MTHGQAVRLGVKAFGLVTISGPTVKAPRRKKERN